MTVQTLNLSQCKEYIRNIKDLEISCYQQKQLLEKLKEQPLITKKRITELEQRLKAEKEPVKPLHLIVDILLGFIFSIFGGFIFAICGVIVALVVRIILSIFSSNINLFSSPWLPYIFWGAIIGFVIGYIWCLYDFIKQGADSRKSYPYKVELFHKKQQEINTLIENKRKILATTIPNEIALRERTLRQTKNILQKYYNMGFIYPKYQGLVPICTMYEYLESGRCFSLIGPHGAYNLYEEELRMHVIIGKLDDVIYRLDDISEKLDDIGASQRLLVQEIRQSNSRLNQISKTLDNIENNTALTQYYSSITASNTAFMSWLEMFNTNY